MASEGKEEDGPMCPSSLIGSLSTASGPSVMPSNEIRVAALS